MAPSPAAPSLLQETCASLVATLSRSVAGIPAEQLCCDYRNIKGEGIPFRRLGFHSLGSFLSSVPETCSVKRLPSGGMLVALPGQGGPTSQATNYKQARQFMKPKKPIRRPHQQSTNWVPPQHQGKLFPRGQAGRGNGQQNYNTRKPLREPKIRREGSQTQIRREGSQTQIRREGSQTLSRREGSQTQIRREESQTQIRREGDQTQIRRESNQKQRESSQRQKRKENGQSQIKKCTTADSKQPEKSQRNELQEYFSKRQYGVVKYKIATIGSKGKERFMATVCVEESQYKTYPDTYHTQAEAEEALASIVLTALGITGQGGDNRRKETKDMLVYAQRVVSLLGERFNGVWSHQVENEYSEKYQEQLPSNWITKMEEINQIKIESPIPDSIRFIIFPVSQDFFSNLPPAITFPEDDIWEVFVTIVRSSKNISVRIIGSKFSEMFDNLISDMDLHYFDKSSELDVIEPEVGKLYAAQVSSDWHRVQILSSTMETCSCLFIDHGDEDTILKEDLRELNPKFLLVPPQMVMVEMAGLQEYQHSDAIVNELNQRLLGKSLAAKVENRSKLGVRLTPTTDELPRLIFFDTSSENEDININQKLIELIVSEGSETRLPKPGGEEVDVRVSFIMESGDIYVRKEGEVKEGRKEEVSEGDLAILRRESCSEKKAIKCRLDGVPPKGHTWSPSATEALRELVPEDEVVTLRVVREEDGWPYVELHFPDSNDGSINFDLSTEFDIFPLAPCEMIKNDANNNNNEELKSIREESENEETDNSPHSESDTFDLFSLKTLLPPLIPPQGSYFDLTVTFAVSPNMFIIQPHSQGSSLTALQSSMASCYYDSTIHSIDLASKERYYAAMIDGEVGTWHRVEIQHYIPGGDNSQAIVRYVDQGSSAMLPVSDLRPLLAQFRNLPIQAVQAGLAGVVPGGDDWTPEDNYWFNNRVAGKMFVGRVMENTDNNILVELVDTSHPTEDHYIHKQLIMDGRAVAGK